MVCSDACHQRTCSLRSDSCMAAGRLVRNNLTTLPMSKLLQSSAASGPGARSRNVRRVLWALSGPRPALACPSAAAGTTGGALGSAEPLPPGRPSVGVADGAAATPGSAEPLPPERLSDSATASSPAAPSSWPSMVPGIPAVALRLALVCGSCGCRLLLRLSCSPTVVPHLQPAS